MRNQETGKLDCIPPLTLYPIEGILSSPMPSPELREQFGLDFGNLAGHDEISIAVRLLCAARFSSAPDETAISAAFNFNIGSFVQLTILRRDSIQSQIVHRWPDVVGEKIDPMRGEAIPGFLRQPSQ